MTTTVDGPGGLTSPTGQQPAGSASGQVGLGRVLCRSIVTLSIVMVVSAPAHVKYAEFGPAQLRCLNLQPGACPACCALLPDHVLQGPAQRLAQVQRENQLLRQHLDQANRLLAAPDRPALDEALASGLKVAAAANICCMGCLSHQQSSCGHLLVKRWPLHTPSSCGQAASLRPAQLLGCGLVVLLTAPTHPCWCLQEMTQHTAELSQQLAEAKEETIKYRWAVSAASAGHTLGSARGAATPLAFAAAAAGASNVLRGALTQWMHARQTAHSQSRVDGCLCLPVVLSCREAAQQLQAAKLKLEQELTSQQFQVQVCWCPALVQT